MTISGTSQGYTLEVAAGVHATLILDNVTIQFNRTADSQKVPINIVTNIMDLGGSERTTAATEGSQITNPTSLHLILADGSTNTLTAGYAAPGIRCGEGSRLVVDDAVLNIDSTGNAITPAEGRIPYDCTLQNGTAVKQGDPLYLMDSVNPGKLICEGGAGGAGIGSAPHENSGTIVINGGNIEASAYGNNNINTTTDRDYQKTGAGIGGSYGGGGMDITINGGNIVAKGSYHGAGIGAGCTSLPAMTTNSTPGYEKPEMPGAIRTREYRSGQRCRSITINGGNVETWGYIHGFSLGDGCGGLSSDGHALTITGGNVTPQKDLSGTSASHTGGYLGASGLSIVVQGGSFDVPYFGFASNPSATSVTDGRGHTLQMVTINLGAFDELKGAQLKDLTVTVDGAPLTTDDGEPYDYGLPYGVDAAGCVYFWLPSTVNGKPLSSQTVSIGRFETSVLDPDTGDRTDKPADYDFVVPNPGTGALAKWFVEINIDDHVEETPDLKAALFKRYDGEPVGLGGDLADTIASFNVPAGEPKEGYIDDASALSFSHQRTHDKNGDETTDTVQSGALFSDVGSYDLIAESHQYSQSTEFPEFTKTFWGHKLYFSAAITPADSKISMVEHVIDYDETVGSADKPVKGITFTAHVMPRDVVGDGGEAPEAKTCASPDGTVQFYANGVAVGDPVEVMPASETTENGYHYSVATLVWDKTGVQIPRNPDGTIEITAKYTGGTNYLASESNDDRTTEEAEPDFPFGNTPQITVKPQNPDPSVPVPDISPEGVATPGEKDPDATDKDLSNTLHSTANDRVSYPVTPGAALLTPEAGLKDWAEQRYDIPAGCEISSLTVESADGTPAPGVDPSKEGNYLVNIVVRDTVTGNTTTLAVDYAVVTPPTVNIPVTPTGPSQVPSDQVSGEPNAGTVHSTGRDTVSRPVKEGHSETPATLQAWAAQRYDVPDNCTMSAPTITQDGNPLDSIDCSTPGDYAVSFVVTDERGNSTTVLVDYHVTNPPAVTIPGNTGTDSPDTTGPVEEGPGLGTVHRTVTDTLTRPLAPGQKDTADWLRSWAEERYAIPDDCTLEGPVITDASGKQISEIDRSKPGSYQVHYEVADPLGNSTFIKVGYAIHGAPEVTPTDPDKSDLVEKGPTTTDPDGTEHKNLEDKKPVVVTPDPDNPSKPITKDDIKQEVQDRYDLPEGSEIEITITDPNGNPVDEIDPSRPGDYKVTVTVKNSVGDTTTIEMTYRVTEADKSASAEGEGSSGQDPSSESTVMRKKLPQTDDATTWSTFAFAGALASLAASVLAFLRRRSE